MLLFSVAYRHLDENDILEIFLNVKQVFSHFVVVVVVSHPQSLFCILLMVMQ